MKPEQPAQQQEPVAKVDYKQRDGFRWLNHLGWQRIPDGATLYTSPPAQQQEPWVGLTEWERGDCVDRGVARGDGWAAILEEVEAKLREKNGR